MFQVPCDVCGRMFDMKVSRLKRTKTHTCSMNCGREMKKSATKGNGNPNKKYDVDPSFLNEIDTEFKAWLLGWIASDGHISGSGNSICIQIHEKDIDALDTIRRYFGLPYTFIKKYPEKKQVKITFCIEEWKTAVCNHLSISGGKKFKTLEYPKNLPKWLDASFIRGYFEGDGHVSGLQELARRGYAAATIYSSSQCMIDSLKQHSDGLLSGNKPTIAAYGPKAIDFLGWIYGYANFKLQRKYSTYIEIAAFRRGGLGKFLWEKRHPEAVPPRKKRGSDSGYDLTVISVVSSVGNYTLYDTGIRVVPPPGIYFDVVPRSSVWDSGYIMPNSVGVIDCSYIGTIKIGLFKVDQGSPDLVLPARIAQMIPRNLVHLECKEGEVDEGFTSRGNGGFGSTGK